MTKSEFSAFIKAEVSEAIRSNKEELKKMFPDSVGDFLTIKEAAEKFKVTKVTIHNWAKEGAIKKHKIQGRTLLKLSELQEKFN